MEEQNASPYANEFSEDGFWKKVGDFAKQAGREAIEKALTLYYAFQDPQVPAWAKAVIVGALGYFISPLDAIPDLVPAIGYADDVGVMVAALAAIAVHVSDETKRKAAEKVAEWFDK